MCSFFILLGSKVTDRRNTLEYDEARRKSGSYKTSGLSQEDHASKAEAQEIAKKLQRGASLVAKRDEAGGESLTSAEQQTLEEYETGKLAKHKDAIKQRRVQKPANFRM